ncbi:hypothetical protein NDN08_003874 [Rhodosorus marinus]|uniref:Uncharacterized protein n=1 Tax=Rhodosorus marinus TaxID=101924 RepID=A0AAV8UGQ0_9RHOD|nr:hypothetical protein NDN08_003874 [Rhodosorus marinus]
MEHESSGEEGGVTTRQVTKENVLELIKTVIPLKYVFGAVSLASFYGMYYFIFVDKSVEVKEGILAALFFAYFIVVIWTTGVNDSSEKIVSIAPNINVLRAAIPFSVLITLALPLYLYISTDDEQVRVLLGRPLFWFFVERFFEWCISRPRASIVSRLIIVLTLQLYRLGVVYQCFLQSVDFNVWIQMLAAVNFLYWGGMVSVYGLLVVSRQYFDSDCIRRQLSETTD